MNHDVSFTPTPIYCNNQVAITFASKPKFHSCTKHIDIHFHFVQQHIKEGTFMLSYSPTEDNLADTFTKALPCPRLQQLQLQMSLDCTQGGVLDSERSNKL